MGLFPYFTYKLAIFCSSYQPKIFVTLFKYINIAYILSIIQPFGKYHIPWHVCLSQEETMSGKINLVDTFMLYPKKDVVKIPCPFTLVCLCLSCIKPSTVSRHVMSNSGIIINSGWIYFKAESFW